MRPESPKLVWDALEAAQWIVNHASGRTFEEYVLDHMLRLAIERQFITLGEALNQLARRDPEAANGIAQIHQIIAFRNILVHGYSEIDDELVWTVATGELTPLIQALERLLEN